MLAGMSAGVVASITAVTPTERIKTALIDDARNAKRFNSAPHAVAMIYKETGLLGLYRGYVFSVDLFLVEILFQSVDYAAGVAF